MSRTQRIQVRLVAADDAIQATTKEELRLEICNVCHPFFTGKQKFVDTAGRVERFRQRYGQG